jgi:hypothetical protein
MGTALQQNCAKKVDVFPLKTLIDHWSMPLTGVALGLYL